MRSFFLLLLALITGAGVSVCEARPGAQSPIGKAQRNANFCELFTNAFTEWDADHNGKLDYTELSAAIADPKIHTTQSAVAVAFHDKMVIDECDVTNVLMLKDAVALAKSAQVQKAFLSRAWNASTFAHSLFSLNDPNLLTIQQGGLGDCYLVSVIGTFVYHNPQAFWVMIAPQTDGSYEIQFDSGKMISVTPVTETELMLAGNQSRRHGMWLTVLEKAYRQFSREENLEPALEKTEASEASEAMGLAGHSGRCAPVITLLTGHTTADAPMGRWVEEDPTNGLEKVQALLSRLLQERQLVVVGTSKDPSVPLPSGIAHSHALGVLSYDSKTRMVTLFNPRGNHLKPVDPPGLTNGYPTNHGIFQVPLADFVKIFGSFTYETDTFVDIAKAATVHSCEMIAGH